MVKNETNKEEVPLKALVVADCFDRRFLPIIDQCSSWSCVRIANVEILNYTLEWLSRTEIRDVIIAVIAERAPVFKHFVEYWEDCFATLTLVSCPNCMSVGDVIREVQGRSLITSDFLLLTNPASFCSFDLRQQIKAFSERRKDKNNVMTLLYTKSERNNPVVCIEKKTNKLIFYHRSDDSSRFDVDKAVFVADSVVRNDIQDTGIALCSPVICTQFSDNFDFQHRDDIIREILVNEEILCQNIHIDVIPPDVCAFTASDYEGVLRANSLILQRWLFPLSPGRVGDAKFTSQKNNVYLAVKDQEDGQHSLNNPFYAAASIGPNVVLGSNCHIHPSAVIKYSSLGDGCTIGKDAVVVRSIIGNDVKLESGALVSNSFICDGVSIGEKVVVEPKSVIGGKVIIEDSRTIATNSVICAAEVEDEEDEIICTPCSSGFEWKFVNGCKFWSALGKKRSRSESSVAEKDAEKERAQGEGTVEKELNNTEKFLEEVKESMERTALEENVNIQLLKNLLLEINSSKIAYNISMEDVARNVFLSFLSLPQCATFQALKTTATQWKHLFNNYYKPIRSQIQMLAAMEDQLGTSGTFKSMMPNTVHLFYELEILEEEAILDWYENLAEAAPAKALVKPIVDWLNTAEEDESD